MKTAQKFLAYENARDMIRTLRPLLAEIRRHDRNLENQIRRAATSVLLNVSEGNQRLGKDKTHLFSIAAGSANEVRSGLHVAEDWGYLGAEKLTRIHQILDSEIAMLWRLTHPVRAGPQ